MVLIQRYLKYNRRCEVVVVPFSQYNLSQIIYIMDYSY